MSDKFESQHSLSPIIGSDICRTFWEEYVEPESMIVDTLGVYCISWRPVLVVEETGVPGENHRPWASNW